MHLKLFNIFKKKLHRPSYYQLSVTGKREVNQDSSVILEFDNKSIFMAIADGMGGTNGGYLASNLAINIAYDEIERAFNDNKNVKIDNLKVILLNLYQKIQNTINEQIASKPELNGMGTTLASLLIHEGKYVWGNIGDSKIFKLKGIELLQITVDHSYISDFQRDNGNIISTDMKNNYGHLLTKCLDGGDDIPDIFPLDKDYEILEKDILFLLCSDGLIMNNYDPKIFKPIFKLKKFEAVVKKLITKSFNDGSSDNMTLILYCSG
jgi:PPM family protein phosphatase